MTRKECEDRLLELTQEAYRVYREYYPKGTQLALLVINDYCTVFDSIWDENGNVVNEHMVNVSRFADGTVRRSEEEE